MSAKRPMARAITIQQVRADYPNIVTQLTEMGLNRCHLVQDNEFPNGCPNDPVIAINYPPSRDFPTGVWKWFCKKHGEHFCSQAGIAMPTLPHEAN